MNLEFGHSPTHRDNINEINNVATMFLTLHKY